LKEEGLAIGHFAQSALQFAGFTCKNERRKAGQLRLNGLQCGLIGIGWHLLHRL
jgi:hypothetical protein